MGMVVMSKRELNRLDVLARLDSDRLTARAAAEHPSCSPKWLSERELVSRSVFDVINMLKRNMVARAAVDMIDGDLSMVALRKCDVVIRLR